MQCDVVKFPQIKDTAEKLGAHFDVEFTTQIATEYTIEEQRAIRQNHQYLTAAWIEYARSSGNTVLGGATKAIPLKLVEDLMDVCKHHAKIPILECPLTFSHDQNGHKQLIATLLRFSDELDVDGHRVSLETIKNFSLDPTNSVYWWLHSRTEVSFVHNSITLTIILHPDDAKQYGPLVKKTFIDGFINKNRNLLTILGQHDISIVISADSGVGEDRHAEKLPDDIAHILNEIVGHVGAKNEGITEKVDGLILSLKSKIPQNQENSHIHERIDQILEDLNEIVGHAWAKDEDITEMVNSLILSIKYRIPQNQENSHIHERIDRILKEPNTVKQYEMLPILIALMPTASVQTCDNITISNVTVGENLQLIGKGNENANVHTSATHPKSYISNIFKSRYIQQPNKIIAIVLVVGILLMGSWLTPSIIHLLNSSPTLLQTSPLTPLQAEAPASNVSASSQINDKHLLRVATQSETYWLQNGKLYWITDSAIVNQMSGIPGWAEDSVNILPVSVFNPATYSKGPRFISVEEISDNLLVRDQGDTNIYLISGGQTHHIVSDEVFLSKGYNWADVITVSTQIIDMFPPGSDISDNSTPQLTNPTISILAAFISPNVASPGDTLKFVYSINNPGTTNVNNVRLGAQIRTSSPQGAWIDDWGNDIVEIIYPGTRDYSRSFKVPSTTSSGLYGAQWVTINNVDGTWYDSKISIPMIIIR